MEFFESHAHYDDNKFDIDRDILIPNMYKEGISMIVSAGYSLKGTRNNIDLANKYEYVYVTAGISPNDLKNDWENDIKEIDNLISTYLSSGKILAVGEIGLDYHYDNCLLYTSLYNRSECVHFFFWN